MKIISAESADVPERAPVDGDVESLVEEDLSGLGRSTEPNGTKDEDQEEEEATASDTKGDEEEALTVAAREDKAVWCLRIFMMLVLLGVTIAICLAVYSAARKKEQETFEDAFEDLGERLLQSFEASFQRHMDLLQSFSEQLTSYVANANNASIAWPFVVLPDFEYRAGAITRQAGFMNLVLDLRVEEDEREEFEKWAVKNQGWRAEGMSIRTGIPKEDLEDSLLPIADKIYSHIDKNGTIVPEDGPGPYFPLWQQYPAINSTDVLSNRIRRNNHDKVVNHIMEAHSPVLLGSFHMFTEERRTKIPGAQQAADMFNMFLNAYDIDYNWDAVVGLLYPVFDKLPHEGGERKVVALATAGIYWRSYFQNLLPSGAHGILVVLANSCGQEFTYQVDGYEAHMIGVEDLHVPKYSHLGIGYKIATDPNAVNDAGGAMGAGCEYSLKVYPSDKFEDVYTSNDPLVFALELAAVFIVTAAAFLLYDFWVERRQKKVLKSAQQSGKIVSNLFPTQDIRQRLYEEQEQAEKKERKATAWNGNASSSSLSGPESNNNNQAMIAKSHPHCTICFADLAGFTQWSASRSPEQVFELLEAVYGAFDTIALRRGVFKVETIGDSYVCATGLPQPQKNHAITMVRFANDANRKLRELIHEELMGRLGHDTTKLVMRFGLHSGQVVAGVIRGHRGRYQIFGDTVNTAARLESHGLPGRIHVSETTATLLREAGYEAWLTARDELIQVKGKGQLQTYWVDVQSSAETKSVVSTSRAVSELHSVCG